MNRKRDMKKTRHDQSHESRIKTTQPISLPCGCGVCERGYAAVKREIIEDVQRDGWHVTSVFGGDRPFGYSIGLYETFGQPEIVIVGLRLERVPGIIDTIGALMKQGVKFEDGTESDQVLKGYPCTFRTVGWEFYGQYFGAGIWYYGGLSFPVLQCVYPDYEGRYPWQPGASPEFRAQQPVLAMRCSEIQLNFTSNEEAR